MRMARKFESFLEKYRRRDGNRWSGPDFEAATGGVIQRSYVTNMRKGKMENPTYEKLAAISKAMGFPPELWFKELEELDATVQVEGDNDHRNLSDRVNHLFEVMKNEQTGKSFTNTEVARASLGDLTEAEVEGIRTGGISNPRMSQVVALADVFGIHPSYFLDRGRKVPIIDEEAMEILRDETVSAIAHKSLGLPGREKHMILGIIRQLEDMQEADNDHGTIP
jgi:hypothetical protein